MSIDLLHTTGLGLAGAQPGWVHLVGAGPGDPGLLTLRGAALLSTADIVVAAAPIWPWSRRWGWPVAAIFGVSAGTAAIFTVGWWFS